MSKKLIDALEQGVSNETYTENGALTNRSSLDSVLDYFSLAGAMRDRATAAANLFGKAYAQDPVLALKTMFYLRDIRGGQGERATFLAAMRKLYTIDEDVANATLELIAEYGRWYDLVLIAMSTNSRSKTAKTEPAYAKALQLITAQMDADVTAMEEAVKADKKPSVSLLAKWLPSISTTSKQSQLRAYKLAEDLGMSPRRYRKVVGAMRKAIGLLEHDMTNKNWDNIDFSKLPGQAFRKHVKAFKRHVPEKLEAFTKKVVKGEAKVNAGTIYPYEIYERAHEPAADAMWASLPNYAGDKNALVMADVSGSMTGRPMAVSVSLALYFAERNKGPFAGYYMTFTDRPHMLKVQGTTLAQKMSFIEHTDVGYNTNLEAAFKEILRAAVSSQSSQEDLPKILYIISDMEFDAQMSSNKATNFNNAERLFSEAGYQLPHVVFWNVNARQDQAPATKFDSRVTLISGASPSTFKYAVEGKTPLESMMEVLGQDRYKPVEEVVKSVLA